MLEQYFVKPQTLDRIRHSWLGKPIESYVIWLTERGYAARIIHRHVPTLMHFAEFARARGASTFDELPALVDGFVEHRVRMHRRRVRTKQAQPWVASNARVPVEQMLDLLIAEFSPPRRPPPPTPFVESAPGFFDYLRDERGLKEASLQLYGHNLRRFQAYLERIDLHELGALSPTVLSAFTTDAGRELAKGPMSALCGHVRVFLRYLHRERVLPVDLSASVECPRIYRLSNIPRSISWEEVQRLLEVVDRRAPIGKRDFAILLLLVTYGLRAAEVAALTLDSIDWQRERLEIPERKAGHHTAFPLAPVVGEAIVDYLRNARPESPSRALFLCTLPPFKPVHFQLVSQRTGHHLRKAGIAVARPGSHTLRHTCVQRLVEAQFPLKTIGDYIGHHRAKSTEVYTKINLEALREVALGDGEALA